MIPNFIVAPRLAVFATSGANADRDRGSSTTFARRRKTRRYAGNRASRPEGSGCNGEPGLDQPLLEERDAVVAPERLTFENEQRHAEHMVGRGFVLRRRVGASALAFQVIAVLVGRKAQARDERGDRRRIVGFELAPKEQFVGPATVLEQQSLRFSEESADERGPRIVNLLRRANQDAAWLGPSACIEVRVFRLIIGIDAALAAILDPELERNPAHAHGEALLQSKGRVKSEIRKGTLVVRIHLHFLAFHRRPRGNDS